MDHSHPRAPTLIHARLFMQEKLFLIIAGSYRQYEWFLKDSGLSPKQTKFVSQDRHIRGLDPKRHEIIFYGSYWENPVVKDNSNLKYMEVSGVPHRVWDAG